MRNGRKRDHSVLITMGQLCATRRKREKLRKVALAACSDFERGASGYVVDYQQVTERACELILPDRHSREEAP
jgi:hypothetical protein